MFNFPNKTVNCTDSQCGFCGCVALLKLQLHALLVVHVPAESFHGELYCFKVSK